jgi:hypothetical protein
MDSSSINNAALATRRSCAVGDGASTSPKNVIVYKGLEIKTASLGRRVIDFLLSLCSLPFRRGFTPPTPNEMYGKLCVIRQEANLTARTLHLKNPLLKAPSPEVFAIFDRASQVSFDHLYCPHLKRQSPNTGLQNQKHFFDASVAAAAMALDFLRETYVEPADIFWLKLAAGIEGNFLREAIFDMDGGRWTAKLQPVKHTPGQPKLYRSPNPMWVSEFKAPAPITEPKARPRGYY